jgi:hypothetical protein
MNLNLVRLSQSLPLALISPLGLTREVSTVCKNATPVGSIVRFARSNAFGKLKSFAMKRCGCALGASGISNGAITTARSKSAK